MGGMMITMWSCRKAILVSSKWYILWGKELKESNYLAIWREGRWKFGKGKHWWRFWAIFWKVLYHGWLGLIWSDLVQSWSGCWRFFFGIWNEQYGFHGWMVSWKHGVYNDLVHGTWLNLAGVDILWGSSIGCGFHLGLGFFEARLMMNWLKDRWVGLGWDRLDSHSYEWMDGRTDGRMHGGLVGYRYLDCSCSCIVLRGMGLGGCLFVFTCLVGERRKEKRLWMRWDQGEGEVDDRGFI